MSDRRTDFSRLDIGNVRPAHLAERRYPAPADIPEGGASIVRDVKRSLTTVQMGAVEVNVWAKVWTRVRERVWPEMRPALYVGIGSAALVIVLSAAVKACV